MGHAWRTKYGALAALAAVVMMLMAVTVPAAAGPGGKDRPNAQPTDPDPEPSPPRSADRPGDCYDNPNNSGGGGSNRSGDYDSSCDQSAGDHGTGGNGKCAGCDGKSDYKNPKGQYKNDHNNGYECDHNGGVGKGNPAHSRCKRPTTTTPPPPKCPPNKPECKKPNPKEWVLPKLIEECDADPDMEGTQPCFEDEVRGGLIRGRPETTPDEDENLPARVQRGGRALPLTGGAGISGLLLAALGLVGAGAALINLIKRR